MNITYYELSNYNNGLLIPLTIEVTDKADHDTKISDWLADLTKTTGELCEEIIVADVEDIPHKFVGEWSLSGEFWDYVEFINSTYLSADIISAGIALGIPLSEIEERYQSEFEDDISFAMYHLENCGAFSDLPPFIECYFDFENFYNGELSYYYDSCNNFLFLYRLTKMNTEIKNIVALELTGSSALYLRDILIHGIHNLKNDFHGENNEEYTAFADEFRDQALKKLQVNENE